MGAIRKRNWIRMEMLITIRGEYDSTSADNQRMVWAPEAIWDKDKGEYMIYWSMEGGDVYKLNGQDKWILIADNNWEKYYSMAEFDDLVHWDVVAEPDCTINFSEGDGNPKHGAAISITAEQYEALWEKWGKTSADGTGNSSIAVYDFETVEGNVIKDSSGRGNDAVMVGTKCSGSDQWSIQTRRQEIPICCSETAGMAITLSG